MTLDTVFFIQLKTSEYHIKAPSLRYSFEELLNWRYSIQQNDTAGTVLVLNYNLEVPKNLQGFPICA
jgi:hypothetical protein